MYRSDNFTELSWLSQKYCYPMATDQCVPQCSICGIETKFICAICVQAICTEAGLMALRERRMKVTSEDFRKSKENVLYRKNEGTPEGLYL